MMDIIYHSLYFCKKSLLKIFYYSPNSREKYIPLNGFYGYLLVSIRALKHKRILEFFNNNTLFPKYFYSKFMFTFEYKIWNHRDKKKSKLKLFKFFSFQFCLVWMFDFISHKVILLTCLYFVCTWFLKSWTKVSYSYNFCIFMKWNINSIICFFFKYHL